MRIPILRNWITKRLQYNHESLSKKIFGLHFKNPLGLAAGFDKDGKYIDLMAALGFGFIEIGTVTPRGQVGNPKPRLFRLPKNRALINRMGFNNSGVDKVVRNLKKRKNKDILVGGNIGKNKTTPNDLAYQDYVHCFNKLAPWVDYFVINVSSPNTPGLRALQEKESLDKILSSVQEVNLNLPIPKPILVKISPDLPVSKSGDIIGTLIKNHINGIVVTNTTMDRSSISFDQDKLTKIGHGGLSGHPLFNKSNTWIREIKKKAPQELKIIGVGGICSAAAASDHLKAGADLIQLYTGLIYEGPGLVKKILKGLISRKKPEQII